MTETLSTKQTAQSVKAAALIYHQEKEKARLATLEAADVLRQAGVQPILWDPGGQLAGRFPGRTVDTLEQALSDAQLAIVLGGDGAILETAQQAAPLGVPILGVNLGRLGFMAELEPDELPLIARALQPGCPMDARMMLQAELPDGTHCGHMLNDAVITRQHGGRVLETSLYADDRLLCTIRGDGVIFSTPTGSTAYSLSAGGPIADPGMEAILVTPLCSHSVLSRSFVLDPRRKITVSVGDEGLLSCDGQAEFPVHPGDHVRISVSPCTTDLVRVKQRSILRTIHDKLRLPG